MKENIDLIGLILGVVALFLFILSFFIETIFLSIIFSIFGLILSIVSQNKRTIKLFGVIVNGFVLAISVIIFVLLMITMAIFG